MILSQTTPDKLDDILKRMYGGAPPPCPTPCAFTPNDDAPDVTTIWVRPGMALEPPGMLLIELPTDMLMEVYARLQLPCALKRVCWTLYKAGPSQEECVRPLSYLVKSSPLFRWAYRLGCPFVWNADLAQRMARHGALESLRWAHREGLPWDHRAAISAGKHGHLETLQMLAVCGAPVDPKEIVKKAASHGQIHVLEWIAAEEGYQFVMDEWMCIGAARNGKLAALQWLRARHCPWNAWTVVNAAIGGHLHVIVWARAEGCPWNRQATMWAARNGHLEVLQWLRRYGCKWDEKACMWAARNGHFEVLQWLRAGGEGGVCPWDAETCWAAAAGGHLHILQWALENGCDAIWTTWAGAALAGQVHVLRWLHSQGWKRQGVTKDDERNSIGRATCHTDTLRWMATMDRWDRVRAHVTGKAFYFKIN